MDGVGGSTFVIPGPDWVLVELPMPEMRTPVTFFSAFVESPFNSLSGITPDDPLPIQGIAWDKGERADYVAAPVIAFPYTDVSPIANVNEEEKIFSLLIDLRSFAADTVIDIGLYGFIETYYIVAGHGNDGPFSGDVSSSEFYGSVTKNFDALDGGVWVPSDLTDAPLKLYIDIGLTGFGYERLSATFPELVGMDHEYVADFTGQYDATVAFIHDLPPPDHHWGVSGGSVVGGWGIDAAGLASFADPNLWILRDIVPVWDFSLPPSSLAAFAPLTTTIYWDAESTHEFTQTINCSIMKEGDDTVTSVPAPPVADPLTGNCRVDNIYRVKYFVPTWKFTNERPVPVSVAGLQGTNLWTEEVKIATPLPDYSWSWETEDYPDRPEMVEFGTAIVPNADEADGDITPFNHFGQLRIGALRINRSTGEVTFLPVEADPVDGGETGDGPDGDGTAPGRTANPQLRVWTYSLDGHDYYVLRLGDFLTLVYDDYSEQWMDWTDFASLTWRAHCGINWSGAEGLADTYGSNVVVGDDAYGILWFLDPKQPYDDAPNSGDPAIYFSRVTVGQVPMTGRNVLPCYAAWLTTDMGDPAYLGAGVTLYTSDDAGVSWDNQGFVGVTPGENSPELAWYSLGQIEAPGRLFKIFDNGAITRIDALEMNDPDDQK